MERTVNVTCDTSNPNQLRFCDQTAGLYQELGTTTAVPFRHEFKLAASYPLGWGLVASATYQNTPGPQITASFVVPNAQIAPALGRNLAAGATATASVALISPGAMYGARVNQLDGRISKAFKFNDNRRVQALFDFYNLLNAGTTLALNTTYGPAWQTPTALTPGRFLKLGVQMDF